MSRIVQPFRSLNAGTQVRAAWLLHLDRQNRGWRDGLTRAIQDRLAQAAPRDGGPGTSNRQREHLARARKARQEKARVVAIDAKGTAT